MVGLFVLINASVVCLFIFWPLLLPPLLLLSPSLRISPPIPCRFRLCPDPALPASDES
jgi:hypothetical protein